MSGLTYDDICEPVPLDWLPRLDRPDAQPQNDLEQRWIRDGALHLPGFMPATLVERYASARAANPAWADGRGAAFLDSPEMRDLALHLPLVDLLSDLLGDEVGLTLSLTGWISTEREWHQDGYLNPPQMASHYIAVWIALADIDPDCGPFSYVPGSHRWPAMSGQKVRDLLTRREAADPMWPAHSDRFTTPLFESEIERRGARPEVFLAGAGDVLIWHSRLVHCGSAPRVPGLERRSLIAHYSVISRRTDMPYWAQHEGGGFFAHLGPVTARETVRRVSRESFR